MLIDNTERRSEGKSWRWVLTFTYNYRWQAEASQGPGTQRLCCKAWKYTWPNYLSCCALLPWIHMIVQVTVLEVCLIFIASEYGVGQEEYKMSLHIHVWDSRGDCLCFLPIIFFLPNPMQDRLCKWISVHHMDTLDEYIIFFWVFVFSEIGKQAMGAVISHERRRLQRICFMCCLFSFFYEICESKYYNQCGFKIGCDQNFDYMMATCIALAWLLVMLCCQYQGYCWILVKYVYLSIVYMYVFLRSLVLLGHSSSSSRLSGA
jgi:hypothetical protein